MVVSRPWTGIRNFGPPFSELLKTKYLNTERTKEKMLRETRT